MKKIFAKTLILIEFKVSINHLVIGMLVSGIWIILIYVPIIIELILYYKTDHVLYF